MACGKITVIAPQQAGLDLYKKALDDKYDIDIVSQSDAIINTLCEHVPDAIIVDLDFKGTDPLQLVEDIKHTDELKDCILMVTSDLGLDKNLPDSFWEKHLDIDRFLSAPLEPDHIRAMVEQAFIKCVNPNKVVGPGFF